MSMRPLKCEMCGSSDVVKQADGFYECQHCKTKYSIEAARQIMFGNVLTIDLADRVEDYLSLASQAMNDGFYAEAEQYYNRVVEIYPDNIEAWAMKGLAVGLQSNMLNNRLSEAALSFYRAIEYADLDQKELVLQTCLEHMKTLSTQVISAYGQQFGENTDALSYDSFSKLVDYMIGVYQGLENRLQKKLVDLHVATCHEVQRAVKEAWQTAIKPTYLERRKLAFRDSLAINRVYLEYVVKVDYCVGLLEKVLLLVGDNLETSLEINELLLHLHESAEMEAPVGSSLYSRLIPQLFEKDDSQRRRSEISLYQKEVKRLKSLLVLESLANDAYAYHEFEEVVKQREQVLEDISNTSMLNVNRKDKLETERLRLDILIDQAFRNRPKQGVAV
ncbi:MAG: hypothetical protein FWH40_07345 [Coriobacteriia bacterium]|nr:hypothetical protein [Coriobacteriia bacterium]